MKNIARLFWVTIALMGLVLACFYHNYYKDLGPVNTVPVHEHLNPAARVFERTHHGH